MLDSMAAGANYNAIYLDYSPAFDKVDHRILKSRLGLFGISVNLANCLFSIVTSRKKAVRVKGQLSEEDDMVSGVH